MRRTTKRSTRLPSAGAWILVLAAALALLAVFASSASAAPDLSIASADVSISVKAPTQGNTVTLSAVVWNNGDVNASSFSVRFALDGSTTLATISVTVIGPGGSSNVTASWSVGATGTGAHTLTVTADSGTVVAESNEGNNAGSASFSVNAAPTAAGTVNTTTHDSLVPFAFAATGSSDSDGTIASYLWIFDDGSTHLGFSTTHQYADGGAGAGKVYTVTLIVTDNDGGTDSIQFVLHVINRAPTADTSNVAGPTRSALVFDGTGSSDMDGRIANASWAFSDGVTLYGLTVLRSFSDNGAFTVTLTVRDEDGATDSVAVTVDVSNQAPVPVVSTNPAMPFQPNQQAFFDAKNSFDVDGGIANYTWVFPGGSRDYGWNATFTFPANGTYNVSIVLIDDDGAVGQLTIAALVGNDTVGTRVPTPPVPRITASATTVFTGQVVSFSAVNSTDDTGIISYLWDFGDGAVGVGVAVSHPWSNDGNFIVSLNVTDTDGNSTVATLVIRVMNRPPIAAISASPSSGPSLTTMTFDGTSSSDPEGGTLLYYRWDFGDGTVLYGQSVQHAYAHPGDFTVRLTVTDRDGGEGSTTIVVPVTNRAPTAVAPPDFSVPTRQERLFDAGLSFDLDGTIQSYSWNFGDGSPVVVGRSVKHSFPSQVVYTVTLTVRDDLDAVGLDTMSVTVTNNAPSAAILAQASALTDESVLFTGDVTDVDGTISSWAWAFGDGQTAVSAGSASHSYSLPGPYAVTLRVTDNSGASTDTSFELRVLNRLPVAVISSPSPGFTSPSLTAISFASTGSSDHEPGALSYFWIFGDGGVATGPSVSHPFARAGAFTVILTVSDADGGASSATVPVVIQNQVPASVPAANVTTAETLTTVVFDARGSSDPDGIIQSFLWDFGDNTTSNLAVAEHIYMSANPGGAYTVRLTVFDNLGAQASNTMQVTITNRAPTAAITHGDPVYASLLVIYHGTDSKDTDGVISTWFWEFGDGQTATGSEVSHTYATDGTFVVKLTVTDNRGGTAFVTEDLTVKPKVVYNTGGGSTGTGEAPKSPGFEGFAVIGVLAVVALAAASRRRR